MTAQLTVQWTPSPPRYHLTTYTYKNTCLIINNNYLIIQNKNRPHTPSRAITSLFTAEASSFFSAEAPAKPTAGARSFFTARAPSLEHQTFSQHEHQPSLQQEHSAFLHHEHTAEGPVAQLLC